MFVFYGIRHNFNERNGYSRYSRYSRISVRKICWHVCVTVLRSQSIFFPLLSLIERNSRSEKKTTIHSSEYVNLCDFGVLFLFCQFCLPPIRRTLFCLVLLPCTQHIPHHHLCLCVPNGIPSVSYCFHDECSVYEK